MISTKSIITVLKWAIIAVAYLFLAYKLMTFDKYDDLREEWIKMPVSRVWWLVYVMALLPFNWLFETIKWRKMVSSIEAMSWTTAIQGILAGISTGFFTPNRVGEMVGRIAFLLPSNRKAGVTLSLVNSMTQNTVMAVFGIPACIYFFAKTQGSMETDMAGFLLLMIGVVFGFIALYAALPSIGKNLSESNLSKKAKEFIFCLSYYTKKDLAIIMGLSVVRYWIFCIQFYCMLQFFGVHLNISQAFVAIPANYLLVTFTPSLAFSEAAVRSSSALLFIGAYSGKVVHIALAGISIWAVNFIIPMVLGTVVMMMAKNFLKSK